MIRMFSAIGNIEEGIQLLYTLARETTQYVKLYREIYHDDYPLRIISDDVNPDDWERERKAELRDRFDLMASAVQKLLDTGHK